MAAGDNHASRHNHDRPNANRLAETSTAADRQSRADGAVQTTDDAFRFRVVKPTPSLPKALLPVRRSNWNTPSNTSNAPAVPSGKRASGRSKYATTEACDRVCRKSPSCVKRLLTTTQIHFNMRGRGKFAAIWLRCGRKGTLDSRRMGFWQAWLRSF